MVIRPYGYRIWELLQSALDRRIKETGHQNAYFPLLIPQNYLQREAEHVEGFAPELAVVTHGGGKELDEPLVIRPTSETIVGEMMSKWISSHRDLPLLLNQWANVVRWEMRPRMFLRSTEFLWQEGHTAHANQDEAEQEAKLALNIYTETAQNIAAIPVIQGTKTASERFPGAADTFTIEAMVRDGKALQAGTSHYMGTNFARAFNIQYNSANESRELCHTTSWGMSTRMLGGIIMAHGDDRGLVLPPRIAPYQVVIVPISRNDDQSAQVASYVADIAARLRMIGVRVHVDDRPELSPGFKFNQWELQGVPLRLELGPRDLATEKIVSARRLGGDKEQIFVSTIEQTVPTLLKEFQEYLLQRATKFRDSHTTTVDTWEAFTAAVATGWAKTFHCGEPICEDEIKAETTATPRCIPHEAVSETGRCVRCEKPSGYKQRLIFARAY